MSRQQVRRGFFEIAIAQVNGANRLRKGFVLSRPERRNLARAYAAKLWRERFAEKKVA